LHVELLGGVEDPVRGHFAAPLAQPVVAGHQDFSWIGTDSGRRT
jgi:hypothetical protein